ncbi:hypothetical protein C900_04826 [Fulvivirga imtechensis AK7]|uniref:DUF7079 domain-containing protein n=1 Tax=Fulvivirga imtechensis AK7 TaxID=1237149 RepID=L8JKZ1_9BACT|nr:hypothetical protein [Fulvivirga imtechensis]ELR69601.1 hypothetical protein C900_04826 [Fulvivirga imtechensis AK7]
MSPPENRSQIWLAISEFYLDTELQDRDYEWIFSVFKASDLSLKELKRIDLYEVFPTLQANLLTVAGEWAGFDEKWLGEVCTSNWKKRNSIIFRWRVWWWSRLHYWMRKGHWKRMEEMFGGL